MNVTIVRHGHTVGNDYDIFQGGEESLSKKGIGQARLLSRAIRGEDYDIIFSSDLRRAVQTSAEIAVYQDAPIVFSSLLRERDPGVLIGSQVQKFVRHAERNGVDRFHYVPKGGESFEEVWRRAERFFGGLSKEYHSVLLVSHAGWIGCALGCLLNVRPKAVPHSFVPNASITELTGTLPDSFVLGVLGVVDHLQSGACVGKKGRRDLKLFKGALRSQV